jgi:hypothetical protein
MDFKAELSKLGYNNGDVINVETLIDEILPDLSSKQQGRSYNEAEVIALARYSFNAGRRFEKGAVEKGFVFED